MARVARIPIPGVLHRVHLAPTPQREMDLARAAGRTHWRYSQYVNRLHGRSGHLWQNRFYSCPLGPRHLHRAMRYVERNPVRAKMAARAWDYQWSSARIHVGLPTAGFTESLVPPDVSTFHPACAAWKAYLTALDDPADVASLRLSTARGRPLAGDGTLSKLEKLLGRRLRPLPVGRPRKKRIEDGATR